MAQLVLGIGSSHGPTIRTQPERWDLLAARDQQDPRYSYEDALRMARPDLNHEVTIEKKRERYTACQAAIGSLRDILQQTAPDVLIVVSNPHSVMPDDSQPVFGVYCGDAIPVPERSSERTIPNIPSRTGVVAERRAPQKTAPRPAHPGLADHLLRSLVDDEFDVAFIREFRPEISLEDAFGVVYELYVGDGELPMVPFILSRYLPHQATPGRCYALGQAIRQAVERWDSNTRVALMASGGLSHQIIDEELDHVVIDAMAEGNVNVLSSLSRERLNRAPGTPEILNWVTVAGAMEPTGMTLIDYVPCYRSVAGTGHGVTFGYWR